MASKVCRSVSLEEVNELPAVAGLISATEFRSHKLQHTKAYEN